MNKPRLLTGASMAGVLFGILLIFRMDLTSYQRAAFVATTVLAVFTGALSFTLSRVESAAHEAQPGVFSGPFSRTRRLWHQTRCWLDSSCEWWSGWLGGISTELIGALITTVLLSMLVEQAQLKDNLITQLHSGIEENAIHAIEELRVNGWLADDTLRGASLLGVSWNNGDLHGANLREANLAYAHLENMDIKGAFLQRSNLREATLNGSDLSEANLENANLSEADMQQAIVRDANLHKTNLFWARLHGTNFSRSNLHEAVLLGAILENSLLEQTNLRAADLTGANLYGVNAMLADLANATLESANLQEAILLDANLEGADLTGAVFDEKTVLPDGTLWTEDADLTRFTDRAHAAFWRSDNPDSPAAQ